jgi:hypothetical protein
MTRVQPQKSGRIETTLPAKYARNIPEPNGHHVSWHVESRDRLRATPEGLNAPTDVKTTTIQHNAAAKQYTVPIPTALAHAVHMLNADIEWDFIAGSFILNIENRGGNDE